MAEQDPVPKMAHILMCLSSAVMFFHRSENYGIMAWHNTPLCVIFAKSERIAMAATTHLDIVPVLWWRCDANAAAANDPPDPTTYSGMPAALPTNLERPPIGAAAAQP